MCSDSPAYYEFAVSIFLEKKKKPILGSWVLVSDLRSELSQLLRFYLFEIPTLSASNVFILLGGLRHIICHMKSDLIYRHYMKVNVTSLLLFQVNNLKVPLCLTIISMKTSKNGGFSIFGLSASFVHENGLDRPACLCWSFPWPTLMI